MGRLREHLRLLRLPLAATTVADVWAGFFGAGHPFGARLLAIHGAALALYFAGMALNDVFDAARDASIHPDRPIPSGALTRRAAALEGAALLALGISLASLGGRTGEALLLAAAILLYDGLAKRSALPGALAMGACRYLDVQLGAGFARGAAFGPAVALGAYVAALTLVSTLEDDPRFERARVQALTRTLLLGIFAVDALALVATGHAAMGAAAAALAPSFPLLVRLTSRGRPATIRAA